VGDLPGVTLAREHDVTLEYQVPTAPAPIVGGLPAAPASLETEIFLASWTAVDGKLDPSWTVVANLGAFGLRNVTRLAVSPKGDRLAIVAEAK
jgi:hypothetical protein